MTNEINDNFDLLETEPPEDIDQDGGPGHARITIRRKRPRSRIDKYLQGRFSRFSRTAMAALIKEGAVTVNNKLVKPSYEVVPGDVIELILPPPQINEIVPEPIPLDVIYEDDHLIAINKSANMVVHPARGYRNGTLVNALAHHCQNLARGDDPVRPGIVHRLDKDTTGVIIAAKSDEAHWRMALQFERRRIHKEYVAVTEGEFELDADRIDQPIGSHRYTRERYAVRKDAGRASITVYKVIDRFRGFTYVRLLPETGRTHQLRVHMSFLRHPIVADTLYGARKLTVGDLLGTDDPTPAIERFALHARRLEFRHPINGAQITIEAPLPADFQNLLRLLRERAADKSIR